MVAPAVVTKAPESEPVANEPKVILCTTGKHRIRTAAVLGTYNRLALLQDAVGSIRRANGGLRCDIIVVDGGSSDGSQKWLTEQPDVHLVNETPPLAGAVNAFNLGFALAMDLGADYVLQANDDICVETPGAIAKAAYMMEQESRLGAVAFAVDSYGWQWGTALGVPYVNFGLIRTTAAIEVAKAQGDHSGKKWWNPLYRTYGADTEFGMWLHRLGWRIECASGLRVRDMAPKTAGDTLRQLNQSAVPTRADTRLFWTRWPNKRALEVGPT